jgi:quercetin dioxygenase-like cupin family protein
MTRPFRIARLDDVPTPIPPEPGSFEWKPIRHHLGIRAFGVNAGIAHQVGDWVVEDHTEIGGGAAEHEELYVVVRGAARFTIAGEDVEASTGTLVFVPDPAVRRSARALEPDTIVLYVGAKRGSAFEISPWERRHFDD